MGQLPTPYLCDSGTITSSLFLSFFICKVSILIIPPEGSDKVKCGKTFGIVHLEHSKCSIYSSCYYYYCDDNYHYCFYFRIIHAQIWILKGQCTIIDFHY